MNENASTLGIVSTHMLKDLKKGAFLELDSSTLVPLSSAIKIR